MNCPSCGSEDVDSRRVDECGCGWAQTTPIEDRKRIYKCNWCKHEDGQGPMCFCKYEPTPPAPVTHGACEGDIHKGHDKPSSAVEEKIKELTFDESREVIQHVSGKWLAKELRSLVAIALKNNP